jgi:hypothetical protein
MEPLQMNKQKVPPNPDEITKSHDNRIEQRAREIQYPIQASEKETDAIVPVESKMPIPAETTPLAADQEGRVQAAEGSSIPIANVRPKPSPSVKEEGSVIVARELAGQLGTAPELRAQMRIDELKLSVLNNAATSVALSHFSYRYVYDGVRYWGHTVEWWLRGSQGVGGLARRHVLQAIANSSGIQSIEKAEKPNAVARNLWDRGWKEKAQKEGKVIQE